MVLWISVVAGVDVSCLIVSAVVLFSEQGCKTQLLLVKLC